GYLSAQDRIWQMDVFRRLTQGRLSEIFGEELLETDRLFRSLNFTEKSESVLDSSSTAVLEALSAYSEGVNQYLEDNEGKLPLEFSLLGYQPEKWEPQHSANLIGYMSWNLTVAWNTEVKLFRLGRALGDAHFQALLPDMDLQDSYVIQKYEDAMEEAVSLIERVNQKITDKGLRVFQASNNWAVSGSKTLTGNAILANDMHLELSLPGIWYQMHQVVPGQLNVSGLLLPGAPFIICGHNEKVAWGMTNVMVDDIDFYLETVNPEDTSQYKLDGEWVDFRYKKEIFYTPEGDSMEFLTRFTHRGPVISGFKELKKPVISMRWIGNEFSNEIRSVYLFNRMENWKDFRDAARSFISISQNIAYADVEGNIGMQTAAGIPLREGDGSFVFPGDTSLHDWKGRVRFEELPFSYNPEKGYVASANNRVAGDDYPYYISKWYSLPNRMERIIEMLEMKEKLGIDDMIRMQSDTRSKWAEKLVPFFLEILNPHMDTATAAMQEAYHALDSWDYTMPVHSVASTLFEQFYYEFLLQVFKDEMGEELFNMYIRQDLLATYFMDKIRVSGESIWFDNVNTANRIEDAGDIAFMALKQTLENLSDRIGNNPEDWSWGKVHTLMLNHPLGSVDIVNRVFKLNRGPFEVGGSYHTVSPFYYPLTRLFRSKYGASHRHIYHVGKWDDSRIIIPGGVSGMSSSPYYDNQIDKYLNYRYNTGIYEDEKVNFSKSYQMNFIPGEPEKRRGKGMF
ncbi:MAG: penicillin acylase family protein, partial [Bacteroidota bacterium]